MTKDLIDILQLSREEIDELIATAGDIIEHPDVYAHKCDGKKIATLFYEASTRTRLSFESAMIELGGNVIGFSSATDSSVSKGESVADTAQVISCYADIIAMRHPQEGAPYVASRNASIPVINAGDGGHCHPTQTLADLLTIYREIGRLNNLTVGCCGDLKYGRTVHSLLTAMRHFSPTFHFIAPDELAMPEHYKMYCRQNGIKFVEHQDFDADTIAGADILYMTRVQRERFTDLDEYERVKDRYLLSRAMLSKAKPNMKILHPLPRVNEIEYSIDDTPYAYYFQQAQNGLYARQAILCDTLGITLDDIINDKISFK